MHDGGVLFTRVRLRLLRAQSFTAKDKSKGGSAGNADAGKSQSVLPVSMSTTDKMMEQHSGLLSGEFKQENGSNYA